VIEVGETARISVPGPRHSRLLLEMVVPGLVIEGRFETRSKAGSGGMGTVYRARDRVDGVDVALKILRGQEALDVERFAREANILATLAHPGIVRYVAHGVTATGEHYLAMEWLDGEELASRLSRRGLSMAESVTMVRRAADALSFAHARGLVHRDLKPSNLFLVRGDVERVKLVDFGIARLGHDEARVTRTGALVGTPGYMAPEQIQGSPAYDPRADVFSLGCVLFECLTGRPAFEGMNAMAVLAKILLQEIPRARSLRPSIPEALDDLVARMMARDPELRPRDAAAVAEELAQIDLGVLPGGAAPAVDPRRGSMLDTLNAPRTPSSLTLSEQRLVSVVLAGDPDAAEQKASSRPDLGELRRAVEPHGGHLDALAGGSLLVTTWTPGSAVDRAERAARCALALKQRFASLPVSIVTGRGLVAERVVDGDMIERGVRALMGARGGAVLTDEITASMLGTRFRVDREGAAYLLRGERPAPEGVPLLLGHATPCVGRARELSMLEGVFAGAVAEPVASAVLVVGAPGAGKSRLRREFLDAVRRRGEPVEILAGSGDSVGAGSPYRMLADAIRRAAGMREEEPIEVRRNKLAARVSRHLDPGSARRVVAFIGEIAGTPFPDEGDEALRAARDNARIMGDAMRAAFEDWIAAECEAQPVLLVLEDLHWGDAATVRLVGSTLRNLRDLPLMVLVLARPEVHERFPNLWAEREVQLIRLGPLSKKASEQLVRAALGASATVDVVERLVARAEGNPFYLEELVRAVHAGRADALPDSVLGTVEARLDAEGVEAKRVLRAASIFGDRFSLRGVSALLGPECDAAGWLTTLAARELIAPAYDGIAGGSRARPASAGGSAGPPSGEPHYVFCHALVREAAYAMLTGPDRVLGHRLAGEWMEKSGHTDALTIAEHFRQGEDPASAARWYLRAAEQALEANDLTAAVDRVTRGVECGARGEELGHLRLIQAEADVWRGELASAEENGLAAAELLPAGSTAWFRAVAQTVIAAGKQSGFDRIEERANRVVATAPAPGARSAQLLCLGECASFLLFGGRFAVSDAIFDRLKRAVPDPSQLEASVAAQLQQLYAFRAVYAGDPGAGLEGFEGALAALESAGDRRTACTVRSNLGFIFAELGDFESAEEALRGALAGAERMGLSEVATSAMQNLGHVLAFRGRLEEARLYEQRAVEAFQKLGDPRMEGVARTYLARIACLAGDRVVAEREARTAAEMLKAAPPLRAAALALLARVLLDLDRPAEALPIAREAHETLESLGALEEGESLVRLVWAEALRASGDRDEFARAARAACKRLLARADKISDPAWRERFLTAVPDNARTLSLAR
jgi:tetratricopeptide (TPR) repeat protein/predicted Ser/Thr protein kinase